MNQILEFARSENRRKVVPLAGYPGATLTQTNLKQNLFNPELQTRSLAMLARTTNADAIFTMMDLSVEASAFGLPVKFPLNESPSVEQHPVKTLGDLEVLKKCDPLEDSRIWVFTETVKRLKQQIDMPIGAYVAGPFTLAGLMMGASDIAMATIENPELVNQAIELSCDLIKRYSQRLVENGADMICILEPTAMMLSPNMFEEFSGLPTKNIIDSIEAPSILHICGNTTHIIEKMCDTGAAALSLDSDVSMSEAIKIIPENCVLIGNINPVTTVERGTAEKVKEESLALLEAMKEYDNFILSTGCDLPQSTPIENIAAMKQAAEEFEKNLCCC